MTPDPWALPKTAQLGQDTCRIHSDYRDILQIIAWLTGAEGADLDARTRWYVAMRLFYPDLMAIPAEQWQAAAEFMADFICAGRQPQTAPHGRAMPRLLDWQQDAAMIAAGVSKAAGCDVRSLPYLHWWSFLAFFDAIGEGTLSMVVSIRDKLGRGKKLEPWEQDFYRTHRAQVDLRPRALPDAAASAAAKAEHDRLLALLDG